MRFRSCFRGGCMRASKLSGVGCEWPDAPFLIATGPFTLVHTWNALSACALVHLYCSTLLTPPP